MAHGIATVNVSQGIVDPKRPPVKATISALDNPPPLSQEKKVKAIHGTTTRLGIHTEVLTARLRR